MQGLEKLSEKCGKEIASFKKWLKVNNYEFDDSNIDFVEPKRNKLEMYIKAILKNGNILNNGNEIGDAKLLVKDYKNKTKKVKKVEKKGEIVYLGNILDEMYYICDIDFNTDYLETYFGCKAKEVKKENQRYEWCFEYKGNKYMIYDWCYEDGSFEDYKDTEWHLGGIYNEYKDEILEKLLDKIVDKKNERGFDIDLDINFDEIEWCDTENDDDLNF
jgi:hypothetical protein